MIDFTPFVPKRPGKNREQTSLIKNQGNIPYKTPGQKPGFFKYVKH